MEQDAYWNVGTGECQRRVHERGGDPLLTATIRLMTRLADVPVDLLAGVETLLFRGRERRRCRRRARLVRPSDARQNGGRACAQLAASGGKCRE